MNVFENVSRQWFFSLHVSEKVESLLEMFSKFIVSSMTTKTASQFSLYSNFFFFVFLASFLIQSIFDTDPFTL